MSQFVREKRTAASLKEAALKEALDSSLFTLFTGHLNKSLIKRDQDGSISNIIRQRLIVPT